MNASNIAAMLILSRSNGESLIIGDAVLQVISLNPTIRLRVVEGDQARDHEFSRSSVEDRPLFLVGEATVKLIGWSSSNELQVGIDAPRSVSVVRAELVRRGSNRPSNTGPNQR
jgi:sRNA-binding carbon storage regulator CsrA